MSVRQLGDPIEADYYLTTTTGTPVDVTATLTGPDGTTTPLTPVPAGTGHWTVTALPDTVGQWRLDWAATGEYADTETLLVLVLDATEITAPAWAPGPEDVAVHIPTRTREVGVDNDYTGTFTADTYPTDAQVDLLIRHACTWVAADTGTPLAPGAVAAASLAAALRAAYWVEVAYPERDADVAVYDRLRIEADTVLGRAVAVNVADGGGASDGAGQVVTAHTFPIPVTYGDLPYL